MANIKITVEGPLMDGHKITFKAPCNCDVVEKLDVRYIKDNEQKSKLFTMKDAHGNDLTGLGNLFYAGAYVDVVLDPNSESAYLQNAGTNGYLEGKITPVDNLESDRADLPLSARQGMLLNESLEELKVYSTTEKAIGKWINGKTIYRKVIQGTTNATANTPIYENIGSNIEECVNLYGHVVSKAGNNVNFGWYFKADDYVSAYTHFNNGVVSIAVVSNQVSRPFVAMIEYTKP